MKKLSIALRRLLSGRAAIFALSATLVGALTLLAFALIAQTDRGIWEAAGFSFVIYICALILCAIIVRIAVPRDRGVIRHTSSEFDALDNITVNLLYAMNQPVLVCNTDGKIVLHNGAFTIINGGRDSVGHNLSDVIKPSAIDLMSDQNKEGILTSAMNGYYLIKGYALTSAQKRYCVTVWQDRTEYVAAANRLKNEMTCAMHIVIDNMDELLRNTQNSYRAMATNIEKVLLDFAAEYRGVLKEYERDKYVLFFESRHLHTFVKNKFDLLDRVRAIHVGDLEIPATVSIGVASVSGDLFDRERAAATAIDMAIQRGGDQAVLKTDVDIEFFGGLTKTSQKRGMVKARVQATELAQFIKSARNVIIMGHRNADYDCFGAAIGTARLALHEAEQLGAAAPKINIVMNRKDPNLAKCFARTDKIEDLADIFIDGATAQDKLHSDTLLIIVDVNNPKEMEAPQLLSSAQRIAYIDHHRQTNEFEIKPLLSYIEPAASSASELITEMIEQTIGAGGIGREEAELMLAGIQLDTKRFTQNCGVRTFAAAGFLRNAGVRMPSVQEMFATSIDDFTSQARFESNIAMYRGNMAIAVNSSEDCTAEDRITAAKVADKLLTIDGVTAAFAICKIGASVRISARSDSSVNVQLILEKLGGGGHYNSAATQIPDIPIADALGRLKRAIDEYMSSKSGDTTTVSQSAINN